MRRQLFMPSVGALLVTAAVAIIYLILEWTGNWQNVPETTLDVGSIKAIHVPSIGMGGFTPLLVLRLRFVWAVIFAQEI